MLSYTVGHWCTRKHISVHGCIRVVGAGLSRKVRHPDIRNVEKVTDGKKFGDFGGRNIKAKVGALPLYDPN